MRITTVILSVAVALVSFGYVSVAQTHGHSEDEKAAIEVGNEICPVSGENVEVMGGGIEHIYGGKIYNLCCPNCVETFKEDPEKYIKALEEKKQHSKEGGHSQHHSH